MKDQKKAEEIAVERMQLLSPLLEEGLDPAKARELKTRICEQTGRSDRTLRRYLARYRKDGFSGLKPKGKGQKRMVSVAPDLIEQAILLRREVPGRSVSQIIQILEGGKLTDKLWKDSIDIFSPEELTQHILDLLRRGKNDTNDE